MLYCGENNLVAFDVNVGKFPLKNGGYFDVGLPKGFPDLMVFTTDSRIIFAELKIKPNRPSREQLQFIDFLHSRGLSAKVIYTVLEFEVWHKNGFL